jgi:cysteine sulfinate desulfinase/cysteine desulfurase-like protein
LVIQHIADLIGAEPKDVVFTSGATESNNMAIKGVARFHKEKKRHVITTQTVIWLGSCLAQNLTVRSRNINASLIHAAKFRRKDLTLLISLFRRMVLSD